MNTLLSKLILTTALIGFIIAPALAQKSKGKKAPDKKTPTVMPGAESTEKGALFFDRTTIIIGSISDDQGPVKVTYNFRNIGKGAITINDVKPDCNCSKPRWENKVYGFNESGSIDVYFYPNNLDGDVIKTLTVYTNGDPAVTYLTLRASVDSKQARLQTMYPQKQGNVRFDSYEVKFPKLFTYAVDSTFRTMYNNSNKIITIFKVEAPAYIDVQVNGRAINPNSGIGLRFKYNAAKAKDYGSKLDEVLVHTNDSIEPTKKFLVRANIEEDFSLETPEFKEKPPVFEAITPVVSLDTVKTQSINTATFVITNKGKSPLYVRKIYGNCGCTATDFDYSKPIKKNKKAYIKVVYNTKFELGPVEKQIYVITNTPDKTLHQLTLKAVIAYKK